MAFSCSHLHHRLHNDLRLPRHHPHHLRHHHRHRLYLCHRHHLFRPHLLRSLRLVHFRCPQQCPRKATRPRHHLQMQMRFRPTGYRQRQVAGPTASSSSQGRPMRPMATYKLTSPLWHSACLSFALSHSSVLLHAVLGVCLRNLDALHRALRLQGGALATRALS